MRRGPLSDDAREACCERWIIGREDRYEPSLHPFFDHVMRLLPEQPTGEIVWAADGGVHRGRMTAVGHLRKSSTVPGESAPGGGADVIGRKADIESWVVGEAVGNGDRAR